ncbi:FAD-dependent oxidoreductase [Hydrogenophaga sp. ZJX-1]|uniref:FAD-dependent oxidoreductase n=1 Tax=Hydrogenophaga sp. ZJX-1 TaxID=3404778 RepID=UPI003B28BD38
MNRRELLQALAAAGLGHLALPARAQAQATDAGGNPLAIPPVSPKARVIVVGGGMAGATVCKYLRMWGDAIDVTLVERNAIYRTCILSSELLTGARNMASLSFNYNALRNRYGVRVVASAVTEVDPVAASVRLADGRTLSADRLVLAPGIEFDAMPGLSDQNLMPHAWQGGAQVATLARQLAAMPTNGTMVLTIPPTPYRCPPGPYERACAIADWMKRHKPGARLVVLDANPDFVTQKDNFSNAFFDLHSQVIEYHTNVAISFADQAQMTLHTSIGQIRGDVINLIRRQRASGIVRRAGLATATSNRFAPVDVLSYASTVAPRVHVIGDSSATTQPKAGHIANQEAKVCADALARIFGGGQPDPQPVTNSACYSTITATQASWLTAVFQYDPVSRTMVPAPDSSAASVGWDSEHFEEMKEWFDALMADSFA